MYIRVSPYLHTHTHTYITVIGATVALISTHAHATIARVVRPPAQAFRIMTRNRNEFFPTFRLHGISGVLDLITLTVYTERSARTLALYAHLITRRV